MIVHMVINRKRAGVLQQLCIIYCKADAQPGPTKRFLPKEQIFYFLKWQNNNTLKRLNHTSDIWEE